MNRLTESRAALWHFLDDGEDYDPLIEQLQRGFFSTVPELAPRTLFAGPALTARQITYHPNGFPIHSPVTVRPNLSSFPLPSGRNYLNLQSSQTSPPIQESTESLVRPDLAAFDLPSPASTETATTSSSGDVSMTPRTATTPPSSISNQCPGAPKFKKNTLN